MNEVKVALEMAKKAHAGQKDKVGADYIEHPVKVSSFCKTERGKIAALLHDVVEDSEITFEELSVAGIGEDICLAVDCLTKRKGEDLDSYYIRIASNDIAVEVKFADMRHNCDISRWPEYMKDKAAINAAKYGERISKLYNIIGVEKAEKLMTKETYDHFLSLKLF